MLTTNKSSNIFLCNNKLEYTNSFIGYNKNNVIFQHLYFVSNECEIKEDEWCYFKGTREIMEYPIGGFPNGHAKKIIATTDPSLSESIEMLGTGSTYLFEIPKPSELFLKQYVDAFNTGIQITEVDVEYYNDKHIGAYSEIELEGKIKLNSKNEIIIVDLVKHELQPLVDLLNIGYDPYNTAHHLQVQRMLEVIQKYVNSKLNK
jgi:hypothetical protein